MRINSDGLAILRCAVIYLNGNIVIAPLVLSINDNSIVIPRILKENEFGFGDGVFILKKQLINTDSVIYQEVNLSEEQGSEK